MTWEEPGQTIFTGQVVDQAALHGILNTIRDLGLPLLEVLRLPEEAPSRHDPCSLDEQACSRKMCLPIC
jgi:hypothetical protein